MNDFTFSFHFHALEKKMATPSSVLVWRISGTGEPGGLLSMGCIVDTLGVDLYKRQKEHCHKCINYKGCHYIECFVYMIDLHEFFTVCMKHLPQRKAEAGQDACDKRLHLRF